MLVVEVSGDLVQESFRNCLLEVVELLLLQVAIIVVIGSLALKVLLKMEKRLFLHDSLEPFVLDHGSGIHRELRTHGRPFGFLGPHVIGDKRARRILPRYAVSLKGASRVPVVTSCSDEGTQVLVGRELAGDLVSLRGWDLGEDLELRD